MERCRQAQGACLSTSACREFWTATTTAARVLDCNHNCSMFYRLWITGEPLWAGRGHVIMGGNLVQEDVDMCTVLGT